MEASLMPTLGDTTWKTVMGGRSEALEKDLLPAPTAWKHALQIYMGIDRDRGASAWFAKVGS